MKNIVITGAGGLVSSSVIDKLLLDGGYNIYALTSHPERLNNRTGNTAELYPVFSGDYDACMSSVEMDCMLHCAFPRNVSDDEWASGIEYGIEVIRSAKKNNIKRLIHLSSQSLYGWNRKLPADESSPIYLNSPYTTGKYCTEKIVNMLFNDLPHTNIRLSTVISSTTEERVTNKLIRQVLDNKDLTIKGGDQIFSFTDVIDVADAITAIIKSEHTQWREIYNLGTEEWHTLKQIAELIVKCVSDVGLPTVSINTISSDIKLNNRINCSAFYNDFGWKSKIGLEQSLRYTILNYLSELNS